MSMFGASHVRCGRGVNAGAVLFLMLSALLCSVGPVQAASTEVKLISAAQLRRVLDAERGKVVLLNLWATYCAPCLKEIPELVALERELGRRGFVVIGVAMDEPAALARAVRPFHAKYFPRFRTYLRNESSLDAIAGVVDAGWNQALPTTYLIDRQGRSQRRVQGRKTPEEFKTMLEPLLNEKP